MFLVVGLAKETRRQTLVHSKIGVHLHTDGMIFTSPDVLQQIVAFQPGYAQDLWPFVAFLRAHYINRGVRPRHSSVCPNSLLLRDYAFLKLQLDAFQAVFDPWFAQNDPADLERLFRVDARLFIVTLHHAIATEKMEIIVYLHETNQIHNNTLHPTAIAAWMGSLHVLKYLHDHSLGDFKPGTMDLAAHQGHMHILRFLHENRSEGCSGNAMVSAAWQGHLDVVQFLHTERHEGCTTAGMDEAASHGHLEIVEFLHKYRREGCTTRAMDSASAKGHLDVVKFLHFNRREGCTTKAMDGAACAGHLDVVQFLHFNRTEGCTNRAVEAAAECNRNEVVDFLLQHRTEGYDPTNMYAFFRILDAKRRVEEARKMKTTPQKIVSTDDCTQPTTTSGANNGGGGWVGSILATVRRSF
ncbi:unnamed protein product [Aphanomyces euteiches]